MNLSLNIATNIFVYLIPVLVIFFVVKTFLSERLKQYHSNWNILIDDFDFSAQEFYKLLSEELNSHGITGISISNVRLKEGNMFSSMRLYLRAEWNEYQYDMCASPYGKGFFISWWLLYKNSLIQVIISKIPLVGRWVARKWYPVTYYKIDTASMFMSYAQASVLKVIDNITNDKGVRALTEAERKPILNNIFVR